MSRHPILKWAQRSDKVFLTLELPDAKDAKIKLEPEGKFIFSATKDGVPYELDIELFDKVNVEESKYNIGVRSIVYVIEKAESKWWTRLLKQEGKAPAFLKVDWDKWVDEDEENDVGSADAGGGGMNFDGMDFSKFGMGGGMPGMGGMGGMPGMGGMGMPGMGGMGMPGMGGMPGMPDMGDFNMPEDDDDDDEDDEVAKPEAKEAEGTSKSAAPVTEDAKA